MRLLVLRPRVGAEATAERIRKAGHDAVVAPLFEYRALSWKAPDAEAQDALMLTSAAAARLGGRSMQGLLHVPVHTVGVATATAAAAAGFVDITSYDSDAQAVLDGMAARGVRRVLHLAGLDHVRIDHPAVQLERVQVYAADAVTVLPAVAARALDEAAVAMLHSPRAARTFAGLLDGRRRDRIRIACFSAAVAEAAGPGWDTVAVAERPSDDSLLAAIAALCDQDAERR